MDFPDIEKLFKKHAVVLEKQADPVAWIEENLGLELYSNQIEVINAVFGEIKNTVVLACRGAGKSHSVAMALLAYCQLYPGTEVIVAGPTSHQAGNLMDKIYNFLKAKSCKFKDKDIIDMRRASRLHIPFRNGSMIIGVSGQPDANVEGPHGHILVIDEAHLVPDYSVSNKLGPMIGMMGTDKTIKIGVAIGKNHFYESFNADPGSVNICVCPWDKAEIFRAADKTPVTYKKKHVASGLLAKMPLPYKKKYFPDRPDLWKISGIEVSVIDWETQYELKFVDDILNFLSKENQERLAAGTHNVLLAGYPSDVYFYGLDTATSEDKSADNTQLSVWRFTADDIKEKVATYTWHGKPLDQVNDIFKIVNPKTGLFKCKFGLVDYSNIGITIVDLFRERGLPVVGRFFGSVDTKSKLNWKNLMYNYFEVQLELSRVVYPSITGLREQLVESQGPRRDMIANMLQNFWEWCVLLRIKTKGMNYDIRAPKIMMENKDAGSKMVPHDDAPSSDVLGVYACGHYAELLEDAEEDNPIEQVFPSVVIGDTIGSYSAVNTFTGEGGQNPMAQAERRQMGSHVKDRPIMGGSEEDGESYFQSISGANSKRRR